MPPSLGVPLTRITVHLETADVRQLQARYGRGWTQQIRRMVRDNCKAYHKHKRTIEDHLSQGQTEEFDAD